MKLPVLCTFALLAATAASHAGSFGGPGPFSNLSPLQSGIDGSYQATARGENLTGVIRFAYQNGVQSVIATANQYNFFVNGIVVSGSVTASITGKQLAGVLGGQDFNVPTNDEGQTDLPLVLIVRGNRANGQFEGQMDLEDRMSAFSGSGSISSAPDETNRVIFIPEISVTGSLAIGENANLIFTNDFVVPGSDIIPDEPAPAVDFDFEGVRTSIFAQGSGGAATAAQQ